MSDFARALRDAAAATAADTVAPPFARIERARQRRRATRAAVAGVAAVAALGGIAIAVPGGGSGTVTPAASEPAATRTPRLKPFWDLTKDFPARVAVRQCMVDAGAPVPTPGGLQYGLWIVDGSWTTRTDTQAWRDMPAVMDRCLERAGYEPYAVAHQAQFLADHRVEKACETRATVVGTGDVQGKAWEVRAYAAEGRVCLVSSWGGKRLSRYVHRTGQNPRGYLHREPLVPGARDQLVFGFTQPAVAEVEVRDGSDYQRASTARVTGTDVVVYGFHVVFAPGGEKRMTFHEYDASGREIVFDPDEPPFPTPMSPPPMQHPGGPPASPSP